MILLLPNIVNIANIIWKDVQIAFSLTLAVLLIWFIISSKKSLGRVAMYGIVGLTLLLILYAGILRHNALFAVLPILFVLPSLLTKRLHVWSGLACMAGQTAGRDQGKHTLALLYMQEIYICRHY